MIVVFYVYILPGLRFFITANECSANYFCINYLVSSPKREVLWHLSGKLVASWACGRPVPRSDGGGIVYTVIGIAHRVVSHTKWYLLQYTMNVIVIIVDSIGHYCTQSKVAQCVGMTLHSGKIEQTQQCGSTDRPNLVWRTQWNTTGTQWYCRNVVSATFYCTL